jgi:hypothetical protein
MGKDRRRAVKAYHSRSTTTRHILTPARVGIYGYIHTIYIRRYGTRDTTLAPWISKSHLFTGSQAHRLTRPQAHRATSHQAHRCQIHRVTGSLAHQSHQPPSPPWCLDHQNHRTNEPPSHQPPGSQVPRCQSHRSQAHHHHRHQSHHLTGAKVPRCHSHQAYRCQGD